jgi:hypothetical protein
MPPPYSYAMSKPVSWGANTYLLGLSLADWTAMSKPAQKKSDFSDEEIENILDIHEPMDLLREIRKATQENPLLVVGLAFAFGLLVGAALSGGNKRSR